MPILYHSNGMPQFVPDSEINSALKRGLRRSANFNFGTVSSAENRIDSGKSEDKEAPKLMPELAHANLVRINLDTMKKIAGNLGLPTAIAKKTVDNRPYASVEDLIAKVPDFDWLAVDELLDFTEQ